MKTYFRPTSKKLLNGKWCSYFSITIRNGKNTKHISSNSLNVEFESKNEADINTIKYCLEKGYIQED
jgi:hypothetical protein